MEPVDFNEKNIVLKPAKGTEHFVRPLPAFTDGQMMLSLWELSEEEIAWIVKNKKLWVKLANFGNAPQPILPIAQDITFPKPLAFYRITYENRQLNQILHVYNSVDMDAPAVINRAGVLYYISETYKPFFKGPNYPLEIDDHFFRAPTFEEAEQRAKDGIDQYRADPALWKDKTQEERREVEEWILWNALNLPVLCMKLQAGKEQYFG